VLALDTTTATAAQEAGEVVADTDETNRPLAGPGRMQELLWMVSHDVRAPLAVIGMHARSIGRALGDRGTRLPATEHAVQAAERIERLTTHALQLMDGLFVLEGLEPTAAQGASQTAASNDDWQDLDLGTLVPDAVELRRELLREAGCSVVVRTLAAPGERLWGHWSRRSLMHVLANLLEHAARHAPGATAIIALSAPDHRQARIELSSRFRELGVGDGSFGVLQRAVRDLGGKLEVCTSPGQTGFVVDLPRHRRAGR
jgi:signal transduction histidine kinase